MSQIVDVLRLGWNKKVFSERWATPANGRLVLRVIQNNGSRSSGRTNHTTRARSYTFDLPSHCRDIDGT